MLPILLCVVGWGWSSVHFGRLTHAHAGAAVEFTTYSGSFDVRWGDTERYEGWRCATVPIEFEFVPSDFWTCDFQRFSSANFYQFSYLGFYSQMIGGGAYPYPMRVLGVPYWFLIVVFSALLYVVWRKTRSKANPKSAFPVEVERQHE